MNEALHDLKVVGTSAAAGGRYGSIKITGEAVLDGDTECRSMTCTGNIDLKGSLNTDALKVTGNCKISGDLRGARLGALGEIEVTGGVVANRLKMSGDIRIGNNCEAETLELSGGFSIGGLMNAERIDVKIHGPCRAKEVGGGVISFKRSQAALLKKMFGQGANAVFTADLIEGDHVILEHTLAAIVRGNRVTIGAGCQIGRVEYRSDLSVANKASVKERVKI